MAKTRFLFSNFPTPSESRGFHDFGLFAVMRRLRHRVIAAAAPWVAAADAPQSQPATPDDSKPQNRLAGVSGTGWLKTASRRQQRRDCQLIETNRQNPDFTNRKTQIFAHTGPGAVPEPAFIQSGNANLARNGPSSASTSAKLRSGAPGLATTTSCMPGRQKGCRRKNSRKSLLTRLRATALPIFLEADIPSLCGCPA